MNAYAQQKNISALYYKHGNNENPKTRRLKKLAQLLEPRAQANQAHPVRDANHQKIFIAPQSPVSRK